MARTVFQQLGKWFPRAGKVAAFTPIVSPVALGIDEISSYDCYLFGYPNMGHGDGTCESMNKVETIPSDSAHVAKIAKISIDNAVNVVSDIPEGYSFYLTDQENGDRPSEDLVSWGFGCFITWSE